MDDTTTVSRQILITIVNFVSQTIYCRHYHPYTHFLQQLHHHFPVLACLSYSVSLAQSISSEIATVKVKWWVWRNIVAEGPEVMSRCVLANLQHADKEGCPVQDFLGSVNWGREHLPVSRCSTHFILHGRERMHNHTVSGWIVLPCP